MTTSAYPTLTTVEQAFKTIVWDTLVKTSEVALASVEATIPIIDTTVFQGLEDDAIQAITDAFFSYLVTLIDVASIQLVNASLQSKWQTASESLSIISQEQGVSSSAYQQALAQAASDFASWVHTGP